MPAAQAAISSLMSAFTVRASIHTLGAVCRSSGSYYSLTKLAHRPRPHDVCARAGRKTRVVASVARRAFLEPSTTRHADAVPSIRWDTLE